MLTDLIELGQKMKEHMKNTQNEIKQNIQGTNSDRKETRTQINDLEQKEEINIQLEQNEGTRIKKKKMRRGLGTSGTTLILQHLNHRGARTKEEQEIENLFEQIMKENFPQSGKGNRIPERPGSPESPKEVGPKQEHNKAHHN